MATRSRPPAPTMRWPPPLPGRTRWAWLLGTRLRGWRLERLLGLLDGRVQTGATVLDAGAGPGYASARLLRRSAVPPRRWILLDPQRGMWPVGREVPAPVVAGAGEPERVVGDANDLPIRSASVDVLLSIGVFCCMNDAAVPGAIAEAARVVRPGGLLLFGVPRWRGEADEARLERAGFRPVVRLRPGRSLLQKTN